MPLSESSVHTPGPGLSDVTADVAGWLRQIRAGDAGFCSWWANEAEIEFRFQIRLGFEPRQERHAQLTRDPLHPGGRRI